jgi:cysteine desulfurase
MYVNNETGAINDIKTIAKGIDSFSKKNHTNIIFHTDAVQAVGKLKIDVKELGVDMLSISAHKIHGPKGVGMLFIKKGTELVPLISGGGQENNLRSGTENVPSIVGLGIAMKFADEERDFLYKKMYEFQQKFLIGIQKISKNYKLNGDIKNKIPSIINFSFPNVQGEPLILGLDFKGILASSGSACSSASVEPSHVLTSMGISRDDAVGSLRLSMGRETTDKDIDSTLIALENVLNQLNSMST